MDRSKQKAKKEKPNKYVDKEKSPSFIADVKTFKENLKIREILRTVKMNSSMRIKAPRGSKVMQNKDFNDNEDIFEDNISSEGQDFSELLSATNSLVINSNANVSEKQDDCINNENSSQTDSNDSDENVTADIGTNIIHKSKSLSEGLEETGTERVSVLNSPVSPTPLPPLEIHHSRARDRQLSLDHTMLSKREGLSQSEVDLHSIGKLPLERKSSFFRKKMDSFLKNTTEIFKRQSLGSGSTQSVQRRGSTCSRMSVSMQSLNENEACSGNYDDDTLDKYNDQLRGSVTSLRSSATPARSNSSLSVGQSDRVPPDQLEEDSFADSRLGLVGSQTFEEMSSTSINSLNESYNQESFLHSRAISMSSGLDTAHGPRKRKSSRSNRVTWVASESLTDYFRRLIQDEKTREIQSSHSYQDFATIPEIHLSESPKTDNKGRRLSYQRAVSGEDPVLPTRSDSSLRRRKITEASEGSNELAKCFDDFSMSGIPILEEFDAHNISQEAYAYLTWAERESNLEEHYDWKKLSSTEEARQAVIKEFIHTEADYIRHLFNIIEVYLAAAHALQKNNQLLNLDARRLFLNIPDVLNANLNFWELVICPMIHDAVVNATPFNTDMMAPGFAQFDEIFESYEKYVCTQNKAVDYLRAISANSEIKSFLTWCQSWNATDRLQLADLLVKPMQRLTKYSLIIRRIVTYTQPGESLTILSEMESAAATFVQKVNRAIRRQEELEKLDMLNMKLEPYDIDIKDDDMERVFRMYNKINLKAPMRDCGHNTYRTIICEGDFRFKDSAAKEVDVHAIILTDMLLICKKVTKGGTCTYKMIRPQYSLNRLVQHNRNLNKGNLQEVNGFTYAVLDDFDLVTGVFTLTDICKDTPNSMQMLKNWELRMREARVTHELSVWFNTHIVKDIADIEAEYCTEEYKALYPDEWVVERRARERVAAMMYSVRRDSTGQEITNINTDTSEAGRGPPGLRNTLKRMSTGDSARTSRLSSLQLSSSEASHEDSASTSNPCAGSSIGVLHQNSDDDMSQSIVVHVVSESECETVVPSQQPSPPLVVLQHPSQQHSPVPRCASATGNHNTLRVGSQQSMNLVRSMPDLKVAQQRPPSPKIQQTASEKLYLSHQSFIDRSKRAVSQQQFLSPNSRGPISFPPQTYPRRLKRGMTFSLSCNYPPINKMDRVVTSETQLSAGEVQATMTQIKIPVVEVTQEPIPSTSTDKTDKHRKESSSGSAFFRWRDKFKASESQFQKFKEFMRSKFGAKSSKSHSTKDNKSVETVDTSKEEDIKNGKGSKSGGKGGKTSKVKSERSSN